MDGNAAASLSAFSSCLPAFICFYYCFSVILCLPFTSWQMIHLSFCLHSNWFILWMKSVKVLFLPPQGSVQLQIAVTTFKDLSVLMNGIVNSCQWERIEKVRLKPKNMKLLFFLKWERLDFLQNYICWEFIFAALQANEFLHCKHQSLIEIYKESPPKS